jgi:hypothetical protein
VLAGRDPAPVDPGAQRGGRHLKRTGQLDQPPLVLAEAALPVGAGLWLVGADPVEQVLHALGPKRSWRLGGR